MARQATLPAGRASRVPSISQYIQESRAELRKVTWPTREETTQLTGAVITMVVAIAAFLYFVDSALSSIVQKLTGI